MAQRAKRGLETCPIAERKLNMRHESRVQKLGLAILLNLSLLACEPTEKKEFINRAIGSFDQGAYSATGMWKVTDKGERLEYIVLFPAAIGSNGDVNSSDSPKAPPSPKGISARPQGLYQDGIQVDTSSGKNVLVLTKSHRLVPIPLDSQEMLQAAAIYKQEFLQTDLWKKKIRPAAEKIVSTEK